MDANDVVRLFTESIPKSIETKNTGHGDDDFREACIMGSHHNSSVSLYALLRLH